MSFCLDAKPGPGHPCIQALSESRSQPAKHGIRVLFPSSAPTGFTDSCPVRPLEIKARTSDEFFDHTRLRRPLDHQLARHRRAVHDHGGVSAEAFLLLAPVSRSAIRNLGYPLGPVSVSRSGGPLHGKGFNASLATSRIRSIVLSSSGISTMANRACRMF